MSSERHRVTKSNVLNKLEDNIFISIQSLWYIYNGVFVGGKKPRVDKGWFVISTIFLNKCFGSILPWIFLTSFIGEKSTIIAIDIRKIANIVLDLISYHIG